MEPKFYFGDLAIVPNGDEGEVVGIWLKECRDGKERWVYRLKGLKQFSVCWWQECQLQRPSQVRKAQAQAPLKGDQLPLLPDLESCPMENPC